MNIWNNEGCEVFIAELGKCPQKSEIFTKIFKNGASTKSKVLHIKSAIGEIPEIKELIKPPKLMTANNGVLITFAKIAYKLILLK